MSSEVLITHDGDNAEKGGITSDFMYNNNVASSHIYIRMGFLRKVYGLLTIQLLFTTVIAGVCAFTPVIKDTLHANPWIFLACLPLSLVTIVALHIKRHVVPINFFLLGGFTIIESITVGVVVSLYEVESVVKALVLTTVITLSLTMYTLQSKRDFSKIGTGLMMVLVVLIGMSFMNIFLQSKGAELVLAGVGAFLFSMFIVYDTHMMMHKLSAEEYILATINLYMDIINLFLELLRIFGERRN